jgi:hypothetical protein
MQEIVGWLRIGRDERKCEMNTSDIIINLGIGLVSGIIAGLITGIIITVYYRCKDSKEAWNKQLHDDKQDMSRFIAEVRNEIELLISETSMDKSHFKRLLTKAPRFTSFTNIDKIKFEHRELTQVAYNLFSELETYLLEKDPTEDELTKYKNRLLFAQLDILKINTSFPDNN